MPFPTQGRRARSPCIVTRRDGAAEFAAIIVETFDDRLVESAHQPSLMGSVLHPDSVGRPHHLCHLRTALANFTAWREHIGVATAGALHDAACALPAGVVSGDPHVISGADS